MSEPYEVLREQIVTPNMADPLLPSTVLPYELRTSIEDGSEFVVTQRLLSSANVIDVVTDLVEKGIATQGESLVLCLTAKNTVMFVGSLFRVVPDAATYSNILAVALLSGAGGLIFAPYSGSPTTSGTEFANLKKVAQYSGLKLLDVLPWKIEDDVVIASSLLDRGEL